MEPGDGNFSGMKDEFRMNKVWTWCFATFVRRIVSMSSDVVKSEDKSASTLGDFHFLTFVSSVSSEKINHNVYVDHF